MDEPLVFRRDAAPGSHLTRIGADSILWGPPTYCCVFATRPGDLGQSRLTLIARYARLDKVSNYPRI